MRSDLKRGKTEIESYNGAIAHAARSLGLQAPVNSALTALTNELAQDAGRREAFRGNKPRFIDYMRAQGVRI
jgi:ketopantoate reductase